MNEVPIKKAEIEALQKNWGLLFGLGILLVLLGFWAAGYSLYVGAVAIIWYGVLLLISGFFQVASLFMEKRRKDFLAYLLMGLLSIAVALWILFQPLQAMAALTFLIGVFLGVIGIIHISYSIFSSQEKTGWEMFNGIVEVLLAILIFAHWPASGLWVIGLYVSIYVILVGWSLIVMGIAARSSKK